LEKHHTARGVAAEYNVVYRLLNAADYGVPQRRERVFIVGYRSDLGVEWSFPERTHSEAALLVWQWATGEYWDRHRVPRRRRPAVPDRLFARVEKLRRADQLFPALADCSRRHTRLARPEKERATELPNHKFNPGARSYTGHTGSPLDEPAKTLKAGDHGVPGGENMLARADGAVRYFTVREAARLQTFADDFIFLGSWTESMRQLGNAVPVRLAESVARSVHQKLREKEEKDAVNGSL